MKKSLAIFLAVLMLLPLCVPAAQAADETTYVTPSGSGPVPTILVGGDGDTIYDEDGNPVYKFDELFRLETSDEDTGSDESSFKESALDVIKSFALGVITGDYDEYYDKLQKEVGELTERFQMDENGDPQYGTDISAEGYAANEYHMTTPDVRDAYGYGDYRFRYDWRKSPVEVADELDAYIEGLCAMTGHDQICLVGRCLGSNFALAYLAKYGYKNRVRGFSLHAGMQYGHDAMSESISGKFKTDGDAINRYLNDMGTLYDIDFAPWIKDLIDFMEHAEVLTGISIATRATIYDQVVEGVSSALALSTMFTVPAYWSCVSLRDYDDAMLYVFGEEGSEKRQKYAGLIEKIEAYHDQVQVNIDTILKDFAEDGGKICVVSKYGLQMTPICESRNLLSDDFVSVRNSSMGATTSMLYDTLPDDYIAQREAEGKGKYISPDRQIDASTGLFPDNTWFLKGLRHGNWSGFEESLIETVMQADRQLMVDDFAFTQFIVREKESGDFVPLTADNGATENWTPEKPKEAQSKLQRVFRFLLSFFRVFKDLAQFLKEKFGA